MKLYFDWLSAPSRAVYLFLKWNNVDFEPHVVDLLNNDNRTPEYDKINPFHQIPVLDDDGFILTESIAIIRYIATKYLAADHWFPKDAQQAARVDEFLNWYHTGLRKAALEYLMYKFQVKLAWAIYAKIPKDEELNIKLEASLANNINAVDTYYLNGKPFIAGDQISAADLVGYCELSTRSVIDEKVYRVSESVNAWMQRVEDLLEPYYAELRANIEKIKEQYKSA